jgi:hypothetical protein
LIARSKLVPDFALTIHFIHLVVTSLYSHGIPNTLYWWFVQAASATLMVSLGMWACQWRELQPMAFGGKPTAPAKAANIEGEGFEMGVIRGSDGAGRYETVGEGSSREPT